VAAAPSPGKKITTERNQPIELDLPPRKNPARRDGRHITSPLIGRD
jgi:hypothetical protein